MNNGKKTLKDIFSGLFRKYPDRAKKNADEFRCVYAGPDYFRKKAGREPVKRDDADIVEVYAGPEYFEREPAKAPEEEDDPGIVEVYAGPEYFESMAGSGPDEEDEELFECVYAGPEYFGVCEEEPGPEDGEGPDPRAAGEAEVMASEELMKKQLEEMKTADDRTSTGFVYAGPDYFASRDGSTMFAPVYAGPQFWNNMPDLDQPHPVTEGVYAGPMTMLVYAAPQFLNDMGNVGTAEQVVSRDDEGNPVCGTCGYVFRSNIRFCPECGALNPAFKPEEKDV